MIGLKPKTSANLSAHCYFPTCAPSRAILLCLAIVTLTTSMMFTSQAHAQFNYQLKLEASPEYDSNARRVAEGGQEPVVSDWLTRWSFIGQTEYLSENRRHNINALYYTGGKLFFDEHDEDVLVNGADAGYRYRAARDVMLGVAGAAKDSTQKVSRRDYSTAGGYGQIFIFLWPRSYTELRGGYRLFHYKPLHDFSYAGPAIGVNITQDLPYHFGVAAGYDFHYRNYEMKSYQRLVLSDGQEILNRTNQSRLDENHVVSASLEYRSDFILRGAYYFQLNNSNSAGESVQRHRVGATGTFTPGWDIYIDLKATLQFTQFTDGLSVSQQFFLEEDDENQTSFSARISRLIYGPLAVEARYALYRNQFSEQDIRFMRQVVSLGLSMTVDSLEEWE